ncbi:FAD-dependent oxidoreductase [Nocardioides hungaricus]
MHVGIVGAGIAGLHLGISLRRHGVDVTIYTDRSSEELTQGRLLNTVMHHHLTLDRERRLGIDHWSPREDGWHHRHQYLADAPPVRYSSSQPGHSLAIDYRLYLPTLMKDFEESGGRLVLRAVHVEEADRLAREGHDLLVVATGRGGMSLLFPVRRDAPPVGVKRRVCAVLVEGVLRPPTEGVTLSFVPHVGELIEIPMVTAEGSVTALLFESLPDSAQAAALAAPHGADLAALNDAVLRVVRSHYPQTAERVDATSFGVRSPRDVFAGAVAPALRHGSTYLPSGRLAVALGDAHVLVDPVMGQGANIAAYSAEKVSEAIVTDLDFDQQFLERLEADRDPLLRAAYEWTNLQLDSPPHLKLVHRAAAENPALAADFVGRYANPLRMWQVVGSRARTVNYLREHGEGPGTMTEEKS